MSDQGTVHTDTTLFREYMILGAVEADLQGLRYWWTLHQKIPLTPKHSARGFWHLKALVNHADILFTGRRRGGDLEGAVFRTFHELGVAELGDPLHQALEAPATAGGRSLGKVIKRMRNAFAHGSHDLEEHGHDIAFWGLAYTPDGVKAWEGLVAASEAVLEIIDWRKQNLIAQMMFDGSFGELTRYIETSPVRAMKQRGRDTGS